MYLFDSGKEALWPPGDCDKTNLCLSPWLVANHANSANRGLVVFLLSETLLRDKQHEMKHSQI